LRTIEGADVIVPNSELISNRVTNWTLADRMLMVSIPVGVSYGSDLRLALQVLREVAKAHPDALQNPAPDAVFIGFGESSVDFEVRVFADADSFVAVRTSLGLSIAEALAAAGIEIPFPQRDLHLRSVKESILAARTAGAPGSDSEPEASA
jgi:small-conductance mechanosensitive channel